MPWNAIAMYTIITVYTHPTPPTYVLEMLRLEFIKGNTGAWEKTSYLAAMEKVKTSAKAAVEALCEYDCFERLQMWSQCECSRRGRNEAAREVRRLRLNIFMVLVLSFLGGLGYSSTLSSMHAFITNPSTRSANSTDWFPTGLGMPESVYFSAEVAYDIAYVIFAISTGFILKFLPFLHTFVFALILNLFGSLLYAVTVNSGMIVAAHFLAGAYNGIVMTASFAYISSREHDYQVAFAQKMIAKGEVKPDTRVQHHPRVKETAFSLLAFSVTVSYLVGPVLNYIISLFHQVEQFHWVGWYTMFLAFLCAFLLFCLFHGESSFHCRQRFQTCKTTWIEMKCTKLWFIILVFFIVTSYVLDSSYGVVENLFKLILHSYFGFRAEDATTFFIAVMLLYIVGSVLLFGLHLLKVNARIMAISGATASCIGLLIMMDWQSIGYDPCTQYSPYHHPELVNSTIPVGPETHIVVQQQESVCQELNLPSFVSVGDDTASQLEGTKVSVCQGNFHLGQVNRTLDLDCEIRSSDSCAHFSSRHSSSSCFSFQVLSGELCLEAQDTGGHTNHSTLMSVSCVSPNHPFFLCATFIMGSENNKLLSMTMYAFQELKELVQMLTVAIAAHPRYSAQTRNSSANTSEPRTPRERCEAMAQSDYKCYWNQASKITHQECDHCPQICRSELKSLNFVQFCIGMLLFAVAIPLSRIALMVIISNNISRGMQSAFTGSVVSAGGVARLVTPLWIVPAFKAVNLRTFLPFGIELVMFLPILLGLAFLYSKLDPQKEEKKKKKEKEKKAAEEEEEKEEEWEELQDLSTTGSSETDEDTTLLELPGEENM